jgi:hypothetical protein
MEVGRPAGSVAGAPVETDDIALRNVLAVADVPLGEVCVVVPGALVGDQPDADPTQVRVGAIHRPGSDRV